MLARGSSPLTGHATNTITMSRFLSSAAKHSLLSSLRRSSSSPFPSRAFIADARCPSAFDENLLRLLRSEITYFSEYHPPRQPPRSFGSFSIEDRPGEQWIRLRSRRGAEDIKVGATMFDGAAPIPESSMAKKVEAYERGPRLHISLVVEVSKGDSDADTVLGFICSAWPDGLDVRKVFPIRRRDAVVQPYMGRDFRKLKKAEQSEVVEYLAEREVDDELAEFLHEYIGNKDKAEHLRWLGTIASYIQK